MQKATRSTLFGCALRMVFFLSIEAVQPEMGILCPEAAGKG